MKSTASTGLYERILMHEHPLITSFVVMLFLFWAGHFSLERLVYPAGPDVTALVGIACGILAVLLAYAGLEHKREVWKGILGLCSGFFWWIVFAEIGETLQWGMEIGAANIPFTLVLGAILFLFVFHRRVISDPTLLQGLNLFYFTWVLHVLCLIVYYSPVFGGPTLQMGEGATWSVWSQARLYASMILWVALLAILVFLLLQFINPKFKSFRSVQVRVAGGFWLLLLFWTIAMEMPTKWFGLGLY